MGSGAIREAIAATLKTLKGNKPTAAERIELNLFVKELRQELQTVHQVNKARLDAKKLKQKSLADVKVTSEISEWDKSFGNGSQDIGSGTVDSPAEPKT